MVTISLAEVQEMKKKVEGDIKEKLQALMDESGMEIKAIRFPGVAKELGKKKVIPWIDIDMWI